MEEPAASVRTVRTLMDLVTEEIQMIFAQLRCSQNIEIKDK